MTDENQKGSPALPTPTAATGALQLRKVAGMHFVASPTLYKFLMDAAQVLEDTHQLGQNLTRERAELMAALKAGEAKLAAALTWRTAAAVALLGNLVLMAIVIYQHLHALAPSSH